MHTYTLKYPPELGRLAYWRISIRRQGGFHIGFLIVALFGLWGTLSNSNTWLSGFGVGICVAYFYYFWSGMRDYEQKLEGMDVDIQLRDEHFCVENEGKVTTYNWNLVTEIRKFPDMWFLYFKNNNYLSIIPVNDIDSEGLSFIEAKGLENGGKII